MVIYISWTLIRLSSKTIYSTIVELLIFIEHRERKVRLLVAMYCRSHSIVLQKGQVQKGEVTNSLGWKT